MGLSCPLLAISRRPLILLIHLQISINFAYIYLQALITIHDNTAEIHSSSDFIFLARISQIPSPHFATYVNNVIYHTEIKNKFYYIYLKFVYFYYLYDLPSSRDDASSAQWVHYP